MTKVEKEEIERLISLKVADYGDKQSAENLVRKYVTPGFKCCMNCAPQVRNMFDRLRNWWNEQNKSAYQFIKERQNG